ncbi:Coenzyme F420 hydrogenase/dehydrogenase, beta subunit C-terminal domain [Neomoorella thermoacetica]|uniref:Coenzyme F420 hydrogenase/dehydrogenase, beta subunit C-terminal domain n=1 Tax=Neomoorella thermoacetica TaxID=1525 RepID=UPI000923B458|nr:Coenzyme F420 hydrogenase/dehydrogenase, beta subunit C-terminal domain [Moorella thermoacetica]OIQ52722.1 electron transport complex subunit RsxB [Moorella thermoacetica]
MSPPIRNNRKKSVNTITGIITSGLCCGCGTCVALCPRHAISLSVDKKRGIYVPIVNTKLCNDCRICRKVCPGAEIDFLKLNQMTFNRVPDNSLLGNVFNCYSGFSTDYNLRYSSASGGVVTALLVYALKEKIVDGVMVVKTDKEDPLKPYSFIARTEDEIISARTSRYCPVPVNVSLREILNNEGRYAVVGLPCHIAGIRKAETNSQKLKERIKLHFCLVCNHTPTFRATHYLLRKSNIEQKRIEEIWYRGKGWPGGLTIKYNDGEELFIGELDYYYWGFVFQKFFWPRRCFLCDDKIGELGDISFMDPHLPEYYHKEKVGASFFVTRNHSAEKLVRKAIESGVIAASIIKQEKILDSQELAQIRRRNASRRKLFVLCGWAVPSYNLHKENISFSLTDMIKAAIDFSLIKLSERSFYAVDLSCAFFKFGSKIKKLLLKFRKEKMDN